MHGQLDEWIGNLPADWDAVKTKMLFKILKRQVPHKGQTILSITQRGIRPRNISENEGQMAGNYDGYQEVFAGDFAMNSMDLLTGWVDQSPYDGLTSPDYRVFAPTEPGRVHGPFYSYVFQSLYSRRIYYKYGQGVSNMGRWRLPAQTFLNFPLPNPSLTEQQTIVEFLDVKTAEIDGLVGKMARQIELLERYRRELIARTVTRGLDPDAPMKDSGIDWIDMAPAAWKTASISVVTDENKAKNVDLSEKNLLSLSYGRVIRKDIDLAFGLLPASFDSYQIVEPGYIVLRMTDLQNDKRSLRSALAEERGIITSAYIGLKVRGPIVSKYLAWLLRFYDLAKVFYSLGGGVRQSANYEEISKIPILVPPEDEQQKIADFLEEKSAQIESTIKGIKRQIELLGRYRKQVINDLVTGKVRVGEVE
ncbi:type I restriction-modification system specificity determinant [Actinobaculum suis]|uniref:Type I restriction-modification system specificity determinant n=1 Tax=Actinobaculum suis TaxID=1657 RepID=A0A7Z8Y7P3_9ACTO|nr:restriction endonuclease subunit S [Actinobaculum suis]VDG75715.1 type I restriction-modification system specificity determinant [Actinobaculum suis]